MVVDDVRRREVRLASLLALFPAGDRAFCRVGGLVAGILDELGVQPRSLPNVVVGFLLELGFVGRHVFALEGMIDHVVGGLEKLVDGLLEEYVGATVHLEFDGNGPTRLHGSDSVGMILKQRESASCCTLFDNQI